MPNEGDVPRTSLDTGVDKNIPEANIRSEKLKGGVANKENKISGAANKQRRSWTMMQIDSAVASEIIPTKSAKLAMYGIGLNRKNDFRLPDLTSRLSRKIEGDFSDEVHKGPLVSRVRGFDIQSQSMRMITANAALGSFQFQKTQVLPYMRRNLSLGYQKVDLLKRVVGSIGSLEKAMIAKLEAIKMNTSAPESAKSSLFRQIKDEMRAQQIKKIASNLSDVVLQGYNATYKKHVAPITKRLHEIISDPTKKGGVNGVIGTVTRKVNELRHTTKAIENDTTHTGIIGKVKSVGAKLASKGLSPVVSIGQKVSLPEGINKFVSGRIAGTTEFMSKANPFEAPKRDAEPSPHIEAGSLSVLGKSASKDTKLVALMSTWYKESTHDNTKIIDHLKHIRHNTDGGLPSPTGRKMSSTRRPIRAIPKPVLPPDHPLHEATTGLTHTFNELKEKVSAMSDNRHIGDKVHAASDRIRSKIKDISTARKNSVAAKLHETREKKKTTAIKHTKAVKTPKITTPTRHIPIIHSRDRKPAITKMTTAGTVTTVVGKNKSDKEQGTSWRTMGAGAIGQAVGDKATRLAGRALKGTAKLGWKATKGTAKFAGRTGLKMVKAAPRAIATTARVGGSVAKVGGKVAWQGAKLGGRAALGATRFAGGLAMGAGRAALGGLGRGALTFAKSGAGMGLGVGLAGAGVNYLSDKYLTGGKKRAGKTLGTAMEYGALGATIGSVIPGLGTAVGGAIGAAVGTLVANSDYVAKAFHTVGDGISSMSKSVMSAGDSFAKGAGEALSAFKKKIGEFAAAAGSAVSSGASAVGGAISSGASAVGGAISSGVSKTYGAVKGYVGAAVSGLDSMVDKVIGYEGATGKVNVDQGGTTKYGVSQKGTGMSPDKIKSLTKEDAIGIYKNKYYKPIAGLLGGLSTPAQLIALDMAINSGPNAVKKLIAASNGDPQKMMDYRVNFYNSLASKDPAKHGSSLKGWMNRLGKLAADVNASGGHVSVGGSTPSPSSGTNVLAKGAKSSTPAAGSKNTPVTARDKLWAGAKTSTVMKDPNAKPVSNEAPIVAPGLLGGANTTTKTMAAKPTTATKLADNKSDHPTPEKVVTKPTTTEKKQTNDASTDVSKHIEKLAQSVDKHAAAVSAHTGAVKDHSTKVAEVKVGDTKTTNKTLIANKTNQPTANPGTFVTMSMKKVLVRTGLSA
jgi:hypothetical protein